MQFQVKSPAIEAERVLLSGQNLYAVAVEGKAHLVDGAVFDLFFALKAGLEALKPGPAMRPRPLAKPARPPKPVASPEGKTPKGGPLARRNELRERMVDLLSIHGPLTTAELAGHLYPEQRDVKLRGQAAWAATKSAMDAGIIERREHNGVDKWALPQSAK